MTDAVLAAWLQAAAAIASLVVTGVLAALTHVYVKHTRRMADEMVEQSQPVVVGRIEPFGNLYAQYVLTNVGLGPALNVDLKLRVDHESIWRDSLLESGKSEFFLLPVDGGLNKSSLKELGAGGKRLTAILTFEDRNGHK